MRTVQCVVVVLLAAALGVPACSGSNPAGPDGGSGAPVISTYVGTLEVPGGAGLGGLLMLKKSSSLAFASRSLPGRWLTTLRDLVEPSLQAQSAATGTLVTDAGLVVALTGTFNSTTFSMTGGGYSITASVNGTAVTGSGTAPGGAVAQVASVAPAVAPSVPANPSGTYTSAVRVNPTWAFKIVRNSDGVVQANCQEPRDVGGNLSIRLSHDVGSTWDGHFLFTWTERPAGAATGFGCAAAGTTSSWGPYGIDYRGAVDTLVFTVVETGVDNGLTIVRTLGFVGVINGNTIQGRFWIGYSAAGVTTGPPAQTVTFGYPVSYANLTLGK